MRLLNAICIMDSIIMIYNNIIDGKNIGSQLLRNSSPVNWPLIVCNNTVLNDASPHSSMNYYIGDCSNYMIFNNIVDGMSGTITYKRSNNLYIGLNWSQDPANGWFLSDF